MNILLAVDGSDYTKRMLAYVAAHEELFGSEHEYTAINVVAPLPPQVRSQLGSGVVDDYYADESKRVLDPVRAFAGQQKWALKTLHAVGHAGDVIADTANEGKFDLLIMGSHGHSAVANLLLGSVASRVLAQCKTPLLLIR
jgi:nucleotide-binding universal stress UspA family protein